MMCGWRCDLHVFKFIGMWEDQLCLLRLLFINIIIIESSRLATLDRVHRSLPFVYMPSPGGSSVAAVVANTTAGPPWGLAHFGQIENPRIDSKLPKMALQSGPIATFWIPGNSREIRFFLLKPFFSVKHNGIRMGTRKPPLWYPVLPPVPAAKAKEMGICICFLSDFEYQLQATNRGT